VALALASLKKGTVQETWVEACEGLQVLRQLLAHDPEQLKAQLHTVTIAVVEAVQNLRSTVARTAILLLSDLYATLTKAAEPDLDVTVSALLAKLAAEAGSVFICEETDRALDLMRQNVSAKAAINSLLLAAAHRTPIVRRAVAKHLGEIIAVSGPRLLATRECDRMLASFATLSQDASPETRFLARRAFHLMCGWDDFEKTLARALAGPRLKEVQELVATLRAKGLGDMPVDPKLARHAAAAAGSAGLSSAGGSSSALGDTLRRPLPKRTPSTSSNGGGGGGGGNGTGSLPPTPTTPLPPAPRAGSSLTTAPSPRNEVLKEAAKEQTAALIVALTAEDWRVRDRGLGDLEQFAVQSPRDLAIALTKLLDAFAPRLSDINSKVNLHALEVLARLVPVLGPALDGGALAQLVPVLSQCLASKSAAILGVALECLRLLPDHVDALVLLPVYCNATEFGNSKVMDAMTPLLCALVPRLYPQHAKMLIKHAAALAHKLLSDGKLPQKTAGTAITNALYAEMSEAFLLSVPAMFVAAFKLALASRP
jgi:DNA-binding phage protein